MKRRHVIVPFAVDIGAHLRNQLGDHIHVVIPGRVMQRAQRFLVQLVDSAEEFLVNVRVFVQSMQDSDVAISCELFQ